MKLFTVMSLFACALSNASADVPKTLFELSGIERPQIKFERSVLVIIDAQQEYVDGRLPLARVKSAVNVIRLLLEHARKHGIPVIHVLHEGQTGGLFDPNTHNFKSIKGLEVQGDEQVVIKHLPDAFAGTSLEKKLVELGKERTLILAGFMTHMCVTATASSALSLGFQSAIVKDAVATRDLRGPNGEPIPAEVVNATSLAGLQDRISWILDSRTLLGQSYPI